MRVVVVCLSSPRADINIVVHYIALQGEEQDGVILPVVAARGAAGNATQWNGMECDIM